MTGDLAAVAARDEDVSAYDRLIGILDAADARYRLIDHAPEGRTDVVSALRGNEVAHAAKCLIVMVKVGKRQRRYALAVVPGDARLDLQAVKTLLGGSYAGFAATEKAEDLAGSVRRDGVAVQLPSGPRAGRGSGVAPGAGAVLQRGPAGSVDGAGDRGLLARGAAAGRADHGLTTEPHNDRDRPPDDRTPMTVAHYRRSLTLP